jgi:FKBP-type peptidyl-prolyl cis-trans isomerase
MERIQRGFMMREQGKKVKKFQEESKKWMEANAKNKGVQPLAAGGQIKIMNPGNGASPQIYDTIEYSMVMKTYKGKELRNSKKMGGSPKHTLKQIGLASLEEAFQKVAAGAQFEVFLQNELTPELGGMAESFEDKYGITIMEFTLEKIIPGKPEAAKPADAKKN